MRLLAVRSFFVYRDTAPSSVVLDYRSIPNTTYNTHLEDKNLLRHQSKAIISAPIPASRPPPPLLHAERVSVIAGDAVQVKPFPAFVQEVFYKPSQVKVGHQGQLAHGLAGLQSTKNKQEDKREGQDINTYKEGVRYP